MAKREVINNDLATIRVNEGVTDAVDKTKEVISEAIDLVEQSIETVENATVKVVTVTKNNPFLLAGAVVVGVAIGGAIAYKLTEKHLIKKYDERLQEEIERSRNYYKVMAKEGEFESPEAAVQALVPEEVVEATKAYQGRPEPKVKYNRPEEIVEAKVKVEKETVEVNVFGGTPDKAKDWDYDVELQRRAEKPDEPYVISMDEFNEGNNSFDQTNVTYYVDDDTLVDERDQPMDNVDFLVGDDNLTRFGEGSGDHNVVYVRNEKLGIDYEIIRSKGSYSQEVLGIAPASNLRHSYSRRGRRRFDED